MRRLLTKVSVYLNLLLLVALMTITAQSGLLEQGFSAMNGTVGSSIAALAEMVQPKSDTLSSQSWWQDEVKYRVSISRSRHYNHCLFGDSITSALGNTLGDHTFNFALGGMSSVSLVEQLNQLVAAGTTCGQVIIAMGTNDADYSITDEQFVSNMKTAIGLSRRMQPFQIQLLPAFYSTVAASQNIAMAGPIDRVEQINTLLRQVATSEGVVITGEGLQSLYDGQALRSDLTIDGVHLNAEGRVIYRNALLKLISAPPF